MPTPRTVRRLTPWLAAAPLWLAAAAGAQTDTEPAAAVPPRAAAQAAPAPAPVPAAAAAQRVEVTGSTTGADGVDERRRGTASRITIGREELDRMGDQSLGEVLKRLPGVTLGGPPGRGGAVRMRGMGGGYTQILIDGQRMPPGFSLESIAPEQIERIEVMRAPVAEHGARAIAGTINVVLRSDFKRKASELRFGGGADGGRPQTGLTVQRNGQSDALGWNTTTTLFANQRPNASTERTLHTATDGSTVLDQQEERHSLSRSQGLFTNGRLAWKLGPSESLELQPFFNTVRSRMAGGATLAQAQPLADVAQPETLPPFTNADSHSRSQWQMGRLLGVWQTPTGSGGRLLTRFGSTLSTSQGHTERLETGGLALAKRVTDTRVRDLSVDWNGKFSQLLAERHSASAGWELQLNQRRDTSTSRLNGGADFADPDSGDTFEARTQRLAAYAQDEWDWSPQLSFYAGARWEGITTRADLPNGPVSNRSSVFTPLAHLVWRLPAAGGTESAGSAAPTGTRGRDQIRASLTRSYRSPTTQQLIGRRVVNSRDDPNLGDGANTADTADRDGNPLLKPELSWGLELGFEHYLPEGGLLGVNLFAKRISNVIRTAKTLEPVAYAQAPRYVARPTNGETADAAGLELEARLRAADLWATTLPLALRANLSLLWSRVQGVPGPTTGSKARRPTPSTWAPTCRCAARRSRWAATGTTRPLSGCRALTTRPTARAGSRCSTPTRCGASTPTPAFA